MSTRQNDRLRFRRLFVLLLMLALSALFLRMVWGFVLAVLVAAIGAGLAYPLFSRLLALCGGRRTLAAAATLILIILMVVGPLVFVAGTVVSQGLSISQSVAPWINQHLGELDGEQNPLERLPFWERIEPYQEQITKKLGEIAAALSAFLVNTLSAATRGTVDFFFGLFILLYAMFFFLIHGAEILDMVRRYVPLAEEEKTMMLDKFVSVSRATLKGTFIIGIVQGGLAGLAFAVVGIEGSAFWATIMAVLSIIPGIGTALVWAPAVLYLFVIGKVGAAVGLFLWCAVIVGTADNFLRPILVGKDTEMPDLMVLLSTFGGLSLFGAVGFVIGPVVAALFIAVWKIYGEAFDDMLAPEVADGPE
jgi:predicted PurR-regulated permease PerM